MAEVGPTGPKSDAEIDDSPTPEDVLATIEWAVNTPNVEMANLVFEDDGQEGEHIQLLGPHYNLSGLEGNRVDTAQEILDGSTMEGEDLEPEDGYTAPLLITGIEATADEHQDLVVQLLNEVYDTSIDDIERVERSTVSAGAEDESVSEPIEATCDLCDETYTVEMVLEAEHLGFNYYERSDDPGSVGPEEVDMIHFVNNDMWECKECSDA